MFSGQVIASRSSKISVKGYSWKLWARKLSLHEYMECQIFEHEDGSLKVQIGMKPAQKSSESGVEDAGTIMEARDTHHFLIRALSAASSLFQHENLERPLYFVTTTILDV